MILDALLMFDPPGTPKNLAQVVGAYDSTNIIDLHMLGLPVLANGQGARDVGIGDDPAMKILVQVLNTFTSGGAGTLSVSLQGAPDNGAGQPGAFVNWYTSAVYALATLNGGSRLLQMDMPRPPDGVAMPRFLKLVYTIAGATMTAGTVTAGLVLDRDDQPYNSTDNSILGGYPAGININN